MLGRLSSLIIHVSSLNNLHKGGLKHISRPLISLCIVGLTHEQPLTYGRGTKIAPDN